MKRHTITEGAKTTAGGTVIAASSNGSINGARIALENDPIYCKACKSAGHILCVGPRLPETWDGKQVALENDLCVCGCAPPPKLIANQTMRYQTIGDAMAAAHAEDFAERAATGAASIVATEAYDLHFKVTDQASGLPLSDRHYLIELANGTRQEGRTDREGKTKTVTAARAEHATLHISEPDAAPINPNWDR
jgi:uncharacterized Zn-binding protein involved in type VI secretion